MYRRRQFLRLEDDDKGGDTNIQFVAISWYLDFEFLSNNFAPIPPAIDVYGVEVPS